MQPGAPTVTAPTLYACDNVFARMAVDVGRRDLAATAETFGFNDDHLLTPVLVWRSN